MKKIKGERYENFEVTEEMPLLMVVCALGLTTAPALSQDTAKGKARGKQKVQTKEKHGREAGELPFGLKRYSEKKGDLPAGLQKKKDEDGKLTRGLEQGGNKTKSTTTGQKAPK